METFSKSSFFGKSLKPSNRKSRSSSDDLRSAGEDFAGCEGQAPITCPSLVATKNGVQVFQSVDTLHLSLFLNLNNSQILSKIDELRQVARDSELDSVPFQFFDKSFIVHRSGRRHFQFHISSGDTHIFFNKRDPELNFPTCLIEIGSVSSWQPGSFHVFDNIKKSFKKAKIEIVRHNVTRVDLCADFLGKNIQELDLNNTEKWICRATDFQEFLSAESDKKTKNTAPKEINYTAYYSHKKITGIGWGSGKISLRAYDKLKEMKKKKATAKIDFFEKVWGQKPSDVTRVEFQLRREFLKEFRFGPDKDQEVNTIDELELAQNALWSYCCKSWSRHTKEEVDFENKHQSRAVVSSFWQEVQAVKFNIQIDSFHREKTIPNQINVKALLDQAAGCLVAAAATVMTDHNDIAAAISYCKEQVSYTLFSNYVDKTADFVRKIKTNMAINKMQFQSIPI